MTGRPSVYTAELAERICDAVAGGVTLCALEHTAGFPARSTIWRWCKTYSAFNAALTDARQAAANSYADEQVYIADTDPDPQRARVRAEARRWLAKCIAPRQYGDKLDLSIIDPIDAGTFHKQGLARAALMKQGLNGAEVLRVMQDGAPVEADIFS